LISVPNFFKIFNFRCSKFRPKFTFI